MIKKIAVLLTCHNRRVKTLQCLEALYAQQGLNDDFFIEVFLVDDASTDGTATAIQIQFPSVNIIQGDGNLFWNRGMYLAWQTAVAAKEFDYYLWLNDDTFLRDNAIKILMLETFEKAIVCGATQSIANQKATYGGFRKKPDRLLLPNGTFQECDYFNGNCVLITKKAYDLVGNLDPVFHHAVGDFDYSLRAKKLGVQLYVAPAFIGICENHTDLPKWRSPSVSLFNRIKSLYTASSGCYPPQFFIFDKRHNGLLLATVHFFSIHLRAMIPSLWKQ
ncbi:MAG: glycosyltransferase family 2 protein [bacterium]|nr:glycosyltransferase family 2 protein [bacterium]